MPKGPKGVRRPADSFQAGIMVARIAVGEIEEDGAPAKSAAAEMGSRGGKARAMALSKRKRAQIAKKAAAARWK
jgi:hypothetical protein